MQVEPTDLISKAKSETQTNKDFPCMNIKALQSSKTSLFSKPLQLELPAKPSLQTPEPKSL